MRIIGGSHKGRQIKPNISAWPTRPTTDFAKEALFNILSNAWEFKGLKVLDLYSGTGNISFEFLSRGVEKVVAIEKYGKAVNFLKNTAKEFEWADKMTVIKTDVQTYLQNSAEKFHIIFADPPYDSSIYSALPTIVFERNLLESNGILIIEHDKRIDYSNTSYFSDSRQYGGCCFTFFNSLV
jgi:16S rRNA (guanine(966)-N(2))-methyltransferase RsmD